MSESTTQTVLAPTLFSKPVLATFDQPDTSSDGGALLLKAVDDRLGLTAALARQFLDWRTGEVDHPIASLLRQRVFLIACGYPDCNDANRLREDPVLKLLLGRDPFGEIGLASQPTLSRFENAANSKDLFWMAHVLADTVIRHHATRLGRQAKLVTIDLDPTDDPTHGAQQLSLFNGHYGSHCYLPLIGFLTFNDEPDQYLVSALLRPGTAPATRGAQPVIGRLVGKLRLAFGEQVRIRVRLDGGFASPDLLAYLERLGLEYVIGMPGNPKLEKRIRRLMGRVRMKTKASGATETLFGETRYQTRSWKQKRRIIMKAEVVRYGEREPRDNPRFLVTNLVDAPEAVYDIYRKRGEIENRIKELHEGLEIDRTSCTSFKANQLRVLMTAAAYVLWQEVRREAAGTECARAQVWTLRERLVKFGAWVKRSVRRVVVHLPLSCPWAGTWTKLARGLGFSTA